MAFWVISEGNPLGDAAASSSSSSYSSSSRIGGGRSSKRRVVYADESAAASACSDSGCYSITKRPRLDDWGRVIGYYGKGHHAAGCEFEHSGGYPSPSAPTTADGFGFGSGSVHVKNLAFQVIREREPAMSRWPDLVRDTRLSTTIEDDVTVHHHEDSDDENNARSTWREERWKATVRLGHGGCGSVWLQQCVKGRRGIDKRAVKVIPRMTLRDKKDNYVSELEAIAKFSQKRVCMCIQSLVGKDMTDSRACSTRSVLSNSSGGMTMTPQIYISPWNIFLLATCRSIWKSPGS